MLLVVARKKGEAIVINGEITVSVLEICKDKVRLVVAAPRRASVHRQEVYDAIHGRNRTSGVVAPARSARRTASRARCSRV